MLFGLDWNAWRTSLQSLIIMAFDKEERWVWLGESYSLSADDAVWISATIRRCISHFLQMYFAREETERGSKEKNKTKQKTTNLFSFLKL